MSRKSDRQQPDRQHLDDRVVSLGEYRLAREAERAVSSSWCCDACCSVDGDDWWAEVDPRRPAAEVIALDGRRVAGGGAVPPA